MFKVPIFKNKLRQLSLYILPMYSTRRSFIKAIYNFIIFPIKFSSIVFSSVVLKRKNAFCSSNIADNKKTLLFIDRYVPHFDKDAGSRSVFQYISCFAGVGFNIKFIGDDFVRHEPYTELLEQMGVEVLYGPYYYLNWKRWIKKNVGSFDYVILSRPYVAIKYLDFIKKHTKAKIFYLGHDLHFLREYREYALTNNKEKLISSEKLKKEEISIMRKSDVVYYFSSEEVNIIKEIDPSINCKVVPLNIFKKESLRSYNCKNRKDLIFVGGFRHSPNVDAILWFVNDIMPIVKQAIPGIILNIIGSNAPDKIKVLESDTIKILGYLEENTLDEYYKKCKICIIPLRYGAGVKGKLLEAMYKQIPVITTTIGAEGLPDVNECLIMEDNPDRFANRLVSMYTDNELLENLTEKGFFYIMKNFTADRALDIFKEDFDIDALQISQSS